MIELKQGDILEADTDALVNTVNCVGIMGRGIALQFKKAFPENFKLYEAACRRNEVQPGSMFVVPTGQLRPRFIVNFPTKRHWKSRSRMGDIEAGLQALVEDIRRLEITSIALPPLGAGLGGLKWTDVLPRIQAALERVPEVRTIVYEPAGAPPVDVMVHTSDAPPMTAGRASVVVLMERYLRGLMDPWVTLLEIHKLMYFLEQAGQSLKLGFAKGPYGPYAQKLRFTLHAMEAHYISGYADGGDNPEKEIEIIPGAVADAEAWLATAPEMQARLDRVSDLVEGFETPFGLELLSTVHWVATQENARTPAAATRAVYAWNTRKRRFSPDQIKLALDVLDEKGWLTPTAGKNAD